MPWLDYLLTIDWATVWKTLLGASLGSAVVQAIFSYLAEHRKRTAQATYLAMRLAVLLDAFGLACSDMIIRNAGAEHLPDEAYPNWEGLPDLPPYPEDREGWVSLRTALAMRCLRLHSSIRASEELIRVTSEYTMEDFGDTLDEQAAVLGLEARHLSAALHRAYGLGNGQFEYASSLEEKLKQARKRMTNRGRAQAKSWEETKRMLQEQREAPKKGN